MLVKIKYIRILLQNSSLYLYTCEIDICLLNINGTCFVIMMLSLSGSLFSLAYILTRDLSCVLFKTNILKQPKRERISIETLN